MSDLSSMLPPAQRPAATTNGPGSSSVSAGGEPKTSAGVATLGAENTNVIAEAGQSFSQGIGVRPVLQAEPEKGYDNTNVSSNELGRTGGFPDSGAGSGSGMTAGKKGTVVGQTVGVHKGTGAISGGLVPGFSGPRGKV
jgi:hypothetical protein